MRAARQQGWAGGLMCVMAVVLLFGMDGLCMHVDC